MSAPDGNSNTSAGPEIVDGPPGRGDGDGEQSTGEAIEQPAKIMRIGTMIKTLLDEARSADLDEGGRDRLRDIYDTSVAELASTLSPDLQAELERLTHPFAADEVPSGPELRVAQAQLVGWLEGLFQGIQATMFAQQMAAQQQLERMRGQLGPGAAPGRPGPGGPGQADQRPGTYL
ncbi:MAG: bacterial proteasome activator family protein [Acidimicrobiia bacterium]|nr:bacterial proteasome activator family protein [Acidimicrobiia bacterium]